MKILNVLQLYVIWLSISDFIVRDCYTVAYSYYSRDHYLCISVFSGQSRTSVPLQFSVSFHFTFHLYMNAFFLCLVSWKHSFKTAVLDTERQAGTVVVKATWQYVGSFQGECGMWSGRRESPSDGSPCRGRHLLREVPYYTRLEICKKAVQYYSISLTRYGVGETILYVQLQFCVQSVGSAIVLPIPCIPWFSCFFFPHRNRHLSQAKSTKRESLSLRYPTWSKIMAGTELSIWTFYVLRLPGWDEDIHTFAVTEL